MPSSCSAFVPALLSQRIRSCFAGAVGSLGEPLLRRRASGGVALCVLDVILVGTLALVLVGFTALEFVELLPVCPGCGSV